jgi:lipopolysaccharide/colanic/teichoic acid biosynthesis glycosyltransferase
MARIAGTAGAKLIVNPPTQTQAAHELTAPPGVGIGTSAGGGVSVVRPSVYARPRRIDAFLIRALDIAFAAFFLLALLPLILVAAVAVRLDSSGPAFYRCTRVGYRGSRLRMLKFRKMYNGSAGLALTTDDDARFTRIGRVLARLKIDEIPQLWHVLTGEMSLVGPRPEDFAFVALHEREYAKILRVRPGITGLSQLAFVEESRILDNGNPLGHYVGRILPQKVSLDVLYAERRSIVFNLQILLWTMAAVVLRKQVAVHRDTGAIRLRKR